MMHNGKLAYDIKGDEKKHLHVNDLYALFDEIRKKEQMDESVAKMLQEQYV